MQGLSNTLHLRQKILFTQASTIEKLKFIGKKLRVENFMYFFRKFHYTINIIIVEKKNKCRKFYVFF